MLHLTYNELIKDPTVIEVFKSEIESRANIANSFQTEVLCLSES